MSPSRLRHEGRRWTLWTAGLTVAFGVPAVALILIEPLAAPAALVFAGHGYAITRLQAARGARSVVPLEGASLGLLGDLLDHAERDLVIRTGVALHQGTLGGIRDLGRNRAETGRSD